MGADDRRRADVRGGPRLYTEEINAAVRGAKAAGATEIVVVDCHGAGGGWTFNSLVPELLDPDCEWVAQHEWSRYTELLEQGCDAASSSACTRAPAPRRSACATHLGPRQPDNLWFNDDLGRRERHQRRALRPLGLPDPARHRRRGDCREGRELLGDGLTTVAVKRGLGATRRGRSRRRARGS